MKRYPVLLGTLLIFTMMGISYSATNFPTNLDTYTDKTSADVITSAGWNNMQDAIEAVEAKVGKDSSAETSSLDYRMVSLETTMGTVTGMVYEVETADMTKLADITASAAEVNTACDGDTAKNNHTHALADGATDVTATATEVNTACDGSTARNSHVHSNIGITGGTGITASRSDLGAALTISVTAGSIGATQLGTGAAIEAKIGTGAVTATKLGAYTAGNYIEYFNAADFDRTGQTPAEIFACYVPRAGTVRVRWQSAAEGNSGYNTYTRVYVNGVATGTTKTTSSTSYTDQYSDITVSAGDEIEIYAWNEASVGSYSHAKNIGICTGAPLFATETWADKVTSGY